MEQFQLSDYLSEINAICRKEGCTKTAAVDRMVFNLNTFNEYNVGTKTLNYHVLGQLWGNLPCAQKIAQVKQAKELIMRKGRR